jgi:Transposase DDE domain group 1
MGSATWFIGHGSGRWVARQYPLRRVARTRSGPNWVTMACELLTWTQMLALPGKARRWEPKRLRLRIFTVAGRITCSGRRLRLRLAVH